MCQNVCWADGGPADKQSLGMSDLLYGLAKRVFHMKDARGQPFLPGMSTQKPIQAAQESCSALGAFNGGRGTATLQIMWLDLLGLDKTTVL
mmetsp:Transcript_589/g.1184  ORF Transcript_589/g.1184 Transcript_589/m.1184 type:complete len:91 (+) Transcript_589:254-526(+)